MVKTGRLKLVRHIPEQRTITLQIVKPGIVLGEQFAFRSTFLFSSCGYSLSGNSLSKTAAIICITTGR